MEKKEQLLKRRLLNTVEFKPDWQGKKLQGFFFFSLEAIIKESSPAI